MFSFFKILFLCGAFLFFNQKVAFSQDDQDDTQIDIPSLQEVVHVATGKAFDKLVRAKACTANDLLILLQQKTHIQDDYLTEVFMQITNSSSKEELKDVIKHDEEAVELLNEVISHFQSHPEGGFDKNKFVEKKPTSHLSDEL